MEQDGPSFWAEIKKFEDTLDKDPNSYCFAPLSELYRKLGMVDDALNIARRGCELHPEYVGGFMALGRAYFEKGMRAECRDALEKVVRMTPDNLLAQRILSQIYIDAGEVAAAEEALNTIIAQNPDDVESQLLLNSMKRVAEAETKMAVGATGAGGAEASRFAGKEPEDGAKIQTLDPAEFDFTADEGDEEILDLLESDIIEELAAASEIAEELADEAPPDDYAAELAIGGEAERKDPLTTVTLAELYVSQGFPEKALAIYRELLEADPGNADLLSRLGAVERELNREVTHAGEAPSMPPPLPMALETMDASLAGVAPIPETMPGTDAASLKGSEDGCPPGSDERAIHALEMWLENIKRRR